MVFQHPSTQKLSGCHVTFELTLGCTQSPGAAFRSSFQRHVPGEAPAPGAPGAPGARGAPGHPSARPTEGKRNLERNFSFPVAAGRRWTGSFSQAAEQL